MLAFSEPEQKQSDRCDQPSGGRNRKAREVFSAIGAGFSFMIRRCGIEARETERAARQVNESDNPTSVRKFVENDAVNHQCRRKTKRDDVGERIKFTSERAFVAA